MKAYPVCLNLKGQKCLVVGGGKIAERKVRELLRGMGKVTVISPDLTAGLKKLHDAEKIVYKDRRYKKGDARNYFFVIAATNERAVNQQIAEDATGLLNVVDMPDLCNVIMPCVIEQGHLNVAVSTSGVSPTLAINIAKEVADAIPADMQKYLEYLKKVRLKIQAKMPSGDKRQEEARMALLKELGSKKVLDMLRSDGLAVVKKYIDGLVKKELA